MSEPTRPSPWATLSAASGRMMLVAGVGVGSFVAGSILASAVAVAVGPRVRAAGELWALLVGTLVSNLWLFTVLPVFCYGLVRAVGVRPLPTVLGTIAAGQAFWALVAYAMGGLPALHRSAGETALRLVALAGGGLLVFFVARRAQRASSQAAQAAAQRAEASRVEYQALLDRHTVAEPGDAAPGPRATEAPVEAKKASAEGPPPSDEPRS